MSGWKLVSSFHMFSGACRDMRDYGEGILLLSVKKQRSKSQTTKCKWRKNSKLNYDIYLLGQKSCFYAFNNFLMIMWSLYSMLSGLNEQSCSIIYCFVLYAKSSNATCFRHGTFLAIILQQFRNR